MLPPAPSRRARLAPPGARLALVEGRPVALDYGSVAAELAVCRKAVGLAVREELRILEVSGGEPWLERLLDRTLRGRVPAPGSAVTAAGTWCARIDAERAIVVGAPGAVERWRRVTREALIGGSPIAAADLTDDLATVSLIGPRAGRLLALAGCTAADAPLGGVLAATVAGAAAVVLRAAPDHWLLLIDGDGAADAFRAVLDAGRAVGLSLVGCEAIGRLAAAARPIRLT